jgi:hypothetical protein
MSTWDGSIPTNDRAAIPATVNFRPFTSSDEPTIAGSACRVVRQNRWESTIAGVAAFVSVSVRRRPNAGCTPRRWKNSPDTSVPTLNVVATLLLVVAAVASLIPTRRAVQIDPQTALRSE